MSSNRIKILCGVVAVLVCVLVWNVISGWGLITMKVSGMPLGKVLKAIERKGHVTIVSNADLAQPVDLYVNRVPVSDALDWLAGQLNDANWRIVYLTAPSKVEIRQELDAYQTGTPNRDFLAFASGGRGGVDMAADLEVVPDPRRLKFSVSPATNGLLQEYLEQIAFKSGAMAVTPASWNPAIKNPPKDGTTQSIMSSLIKSAGGQLQPIFVLNQRPRRSDQNASTGAQQGTGSDGGFGGGDSSMPFQRARGGDGRNREQFEKWSEERAIAQINQLPSNQREEAKKEYDEARQFFQAIRDLPAEQRMAAFQQRMEDPKVQEKMEERMVSRESRRSPEQRAERTRSYVERKLAIKNGTTPGSAGPGGPGGPGGQRGPR